MKVNILSIRVGALEGAVKHLQAEATRRRGKTPKGSEPGAVVELLSRIVETWSKSGAIVEIQKKRCLCSGQEVNLKL